MSIWNKVLLGLIIVLSLVNYYFLAKVYKTKNAWEGGIKQVEDAAKKAAKDKEKLVDGSETEPGVRKLSIDLADAYSDRQASWQGCVPSAAQAVGTDKVKAQLTLNPPDPSLQLASVVFVFEEKSAVEGGKYLGQFVVTDSQGGATVNIESVDLLVADEIKQVEDSATSQTPWTLYSKMPQDRTDYLVELYNTDRAAFDKIVPAEFADEFAKPDRVTMDYAIMLSHLHQERNVLHSKIEEVNNGLKSLEETKNISDNLVKEAQAEQALLKKQGDAMTAQNAEIIALLKDMKLKVEELQTKVEEQRTSNESMATQIGEAQKKAVAEIERRGGGPAQN